ncbi:MAG TPA: hypothetical protein VK430_09845 [Xanthobacteraceae bacterium]|nr:hypothetical protein [Xanthobacteraceae bacterium]
MTVGLAGGVEECAMSTSVGAASNNNPYAYLQALWQQEQSNGATAQSDPLSQLFAAFGQQGTGATSSPGTGSSTGAASASGNTLPQFSPQTLQALLAMQSSGNGSSSQSLLSQFNAGGSAGTGDTTSGQQAHHGHHRHHHMQNAGGLGGQSPLDLLNSAEAGATSQTTANANGSTTTSITYADGSSVSLTTAAPAAGSNSPGGSGSSSGGANVAGNNFIEQLIQLQAQLTTAAPAQAIATV